MDLKGKTIVINGGTKGVGRGIAVGAAALGASIVFGGRNTDDANEVIKEIESQGGSAHFVRGDIRRETICAQLFMDAEKKYGKVDGFVNYTGVLPAASIVNTSQEMYNDVFDTNVKAGFFCTKYAVRSMLKGNGGSIVYIGSGHAYGGEGDRAAYACSKGALLTLFKHVSKNYSKEKIRSNWVTMGWVATPGELDLRKSQGHDENWLKEYAKNFIPMGRLLTVRDHVPGVLYLLSDDSSMVTGTELHINGGFVV